jgi:hypothetical protein
MGDALSGLDGLQWDLRSVPQRGLEGKSINFYFFPVLLFWGRV